TRKVILDDLAETEAQGMALPFGFTRETLAQAKELVDHAVSTNPKVQEAVETRRRAWEDIKAEYSKAMTAIGFNVDGRLDRDYYYRHQVLEYANLKYRTPGGTGAKLRTPTGRGFLRQREGSTLDINT